ncbi:MAG: hypothetical protein QNJ18_10760, partial [Xenococcaceae cyanobacterium MO_167.B52]|nr:hypothetical protein [Xenococcaceae cyanobacterium MO_167.B52]
SIINDNEQRKNQTWRMVFWRSPEKRKRSREKSAISPRLYLKNQRWDGAYKYLGKPQVTAPHPWTPSSISARHRAS